VQDAITGDKDIPEDFDYWVAGASLPGKLEIDPFFDSPYLRAIRADIERFRSLVPVTCNLRVGLCWKGNPKHGLGRTSISRCNQLFIQRECS
jgi:hypothetical protein